MSGWKLVVIVLAAGVAEASPARYPLPKLPPLRGMTAHATAELSPVMPRCFAYAAELHLFACFGHDAIYNMDHVGADDQATNLRIDVVGPALRASWTLEAIGGRPVAKREVVSAELARLGMRGLTTKQVWLRPNTWTRVGAEEVRLQVELREGDASYGYTGEATLRCADLREVPLGLELTLGETAWAFRSPDRAWLAISVVGDSGGEGTSDYTLDTAVIDVASTCRDHVAARYE